MDYQIHMYLAVAQAETAVRHPAGELHPLLVFLRQPLGSGHDFDAAEAVAVKAGWTSLDFTKAGILPEDAGEQGEDTFRACYASAVTEGQALLVYDTVVRPAPPKSGSATSH